MDLVFLKLPCSTVLLARASTEAQCSKPWRGARPRRGWQRDRNQRFKTNALVRYLLLFTYSLGLMPYALAFVSWMAATFLLYLANEEILFLMNEVEAAKPMCRR